MLGAFRFCHLDGNPIFLEIKMKFITKFAINSLAIALSPWLLSSTVHAHAVLVDPTAQASSNYKGAIRIGHGCEGAATTGIRIFIPAGFEGAKPQPKSDWNVSSKKAKLAQPYVSHGKTITEDVVELEWKANTKQAALPDGSFDEFAFMTKLPEKTGAVWLRVLQTCEKAQIDWVEIPAAGTSTKGMKMPAALLTIKAEGSSNIAVANANVTISDSWVRPTVAGQKATGAFMKITAKENSKLLSVSSPVAGVAEVHEMKMDKDVMKMAAILSLDLPAGKAVELKPGSYHIMLMDLKSPVEKGAKLPLTLKFQDAKGGKFQVDLLLDATLPTSSVQPSGAAHRHHH
jgi:copper(I)-binding protein